MALFVGLPTGAAMGTIFVAEQRATSRCGQSRLIREKTTAQRLGVLQNKQTRQSQPHWHSAVGGNLWLHQHISEQVDGPPHYKS